MVQNTSGRPAAAMLGRVGLWRPAARCVPDAPVPVIEPVRVLAALGPRMLDRPTQRGSPDLLGDPEHTAMARSVLGSGPLLAVEQAAVVTTDPAEARRIGRRHLEPLALVISGDAQVIVERLSAHYQAGADHVCLQVFDAERSVQ